MRRKGLFIGEIVMAAGLLAAAVSALTQVGIAGVAGSRRVVDTSDATRSALLAIESLRADTARMVVQEAGDLVIAEDGHSLKLLVPAREPESDPWGFEGQGVEWRLERVPGAAGVHTLVRESGGVSRAVPGCWLRDLTVRRHAPGVLGQGSFLDITVTAVGAPDSPTANTLSFLARVKEAGEL